MGDLIVQLMVYPVSMPLVGFIGWNLVAFVLWASLGLYVGEDALRRRRKRTANWFSGNTKPPPGYPRSKAGFQSEDHSCHRNEGTGYSTPEWRDNL